MAIEPIFRSAQHYPPMEWSYMYENHIDDNMKRISQHELWLDITKTYHNEMLFRRRLVDENRLIKTITQLNKSKIPEDSDLWKDEQLHSPEESEMGRGFGAQDLFHLYESVDSHEERVKALRKGMMTTIQEEDEYEKHADPASQASTIMVNGEEDVPLTRSSKLGLECGAGNGISIRKWVDEQEQKPLAEEVESHQHRRSLDCREIVEDETYDQLISNEKVQFLEEKSAFARETRDALYRKSEISISDAAAGPIHDLELAKQTPNNEQPRSAKELSDANNVADQTQAQLHQRSPHYLNQNVEPGEFLKMQRSKCVSKGTFKLRHKCHPSEGCSPAWHDRNVKARSQRLDAREPLTEVFAEDIKDPEDSALMTPQQTPAQELTERLFALCCRCHDLHALHNSDLIRPEIRPSLVKLISHHFNCYVKYYHDRLSLLRQWTLPRIDTAHGQGDCRRAVLYALFLDKIIVHTNIAQKDPKRPQWEVHQDYDELTELYQGTIDHVRNIEENGESLWFSRSAGQIRTDCALLCEMQDRIARMEGTEGRKESDPQFDAFANSVFADII